MNITRTIDGKTHEITLTHTEIYAAWKEWNKDLRLAFVENYINATCEDDCHYAVYERLASDKEVESIYEEAVFRVECGWSDFETEARMLIDARVEELYDELGITEEE